MVTAENMPHLQAFQIKALGWGVYNKTTKIYGLTSRVFLVDAQDLWFVTSSCVISINMDLITRCWTPTDLCLLPSLFTSPIFLDDSLY